MRVESRGMAIIIAGKTESEILSMKYWTRRRWYRTISPKEKEKAMRIVEIERRSKISESYTPERKTERSMAMTGINNPMYGKDRTEEWKSKHSEFMMGENNPMKKPEAKAKVSASKKDILFTEEHKNSLVISWTPERRDKKSRYMASENNPAKCPEVRVKMSESKMGKNNPNFNNWASREPYCYLWNEPLREKYRNYWGRVCVLTDLMRSTLGSESGLDDFEGYELFSGKRLSVHHIKGDKMAGCNENELALIPLQRRFNSKKFDGLKLEEHPFYITLFLLKDIERKHREEMLGFKLSD